MVTDNIYQAPQAELSEAEALQEFYVVSIKKFCLLYFFTCGIYVIYWFYRNWFLYKQYHQKTLWAPFRAIFSIFFAHSLFKKIDGSLQEKGERYAWSPFLLATAYVLLTVAGPIFDLLAERSMALPWSIYASIAFTLIVGLLLVPAQKAINIALQDPNGSTNASVNLANVIFCLLGVLLWCIVVMDLLVSANILPFDLY